MRKLNPAGLLAASATALLLLSGCTNAAPEPKPTTPAPTQAPTEEPEPEKLEAPTSADEAITEARAAFTAFMETRDAVAADPAKVDQYTAVASGKALERVTEEARQVDEQGLKISGSAKFEFVKGAAGNLTTNSSTIEYGAVTLEGCFDRSGWTVKRADGTDAPVSDIERAVYKPMVVFDVADGRWVVYEFSNPEVIVEC